MSAKHWGDNFLPKSDTVMSEPLDYEKPKDTRVWWVTVVIWLTGVSIPCGIVNVYFDGPISMSSVYLIMSITGFLYFFIARKKGLS